MSTGEPDLIIHRLNEYLTEAVVSDGHKPPVASRIYTYPNIAAYEILSYSDRANNPSLVVDLKPFSEADFPSPSQNVSLEIATVVAFVEISNELVYRDFIMDTCLSVLLKPFEKYNNVVTSVDYGRKVAEFFISAAGNDGYNATRKMPKYTVGKEPWRWKPTPPKYTAACEPYWAEVMTFVLDSSNMFLAQAHTPFDTVVGSEFYNEAKEVYDISNKLTNEEKDIASFWDDNPSPMAIDGHYMKTHKQLTPPGHWLAVTNQICKNEGYNNVASAKVYAILAIAMADGFKSVWDTKYHYDLIRPVTYINRYIDPEWKPFLETPMFPEYTSAHSTISGAAAVVLEHFFGSPYAIIDSSEVRFGHSVRSFSSFYEMAQEVSISRVYGGIHYRKSCDNGLEEGEKIGKFVLNRLGEGLKKQ